MVADSPNIPMPSREDLQKADEAVSIMVLVRGTLATNDSFWAYLAVPPSRYLAFKQAEAAGGYSMSDYGQVIEMGTGANEPPEEVKRRMERDYSVNHNFEEDVRKKAEELKAKEDLLARYPTDKPQ